MIRNVHSDMTLKSDFFSKTEAKVLSYWHDTYMWNINLWRHFPRQACTFRSTAISVPHPSLTTRGQVLGRATIEHLRHRQLGRSRSPGGRLGALLLKYFWSWPRQKGQGTNVESSQSWSHHRALLHTCGFWLWPPWFQVFVDGARLTKARGSAIRKTRIHMCLAWRNMFPNPL